MKTVYILTITSNTRSLFDKDCNHCIMGVYSTYEKAKANVVAKMQEYVAEYFYDGNLPAEAVDDNWEATYHHTKYTTMHLSALVTPYEVE